MFARKTRSGILIFTFSVVCLTGVIGEVWSQEKYPSRSIQLVVPFAPGAGVDHTARVMSLSLEKKWGVRIDVINKPGGATVPALLELYKANPDGYSMLMDSQSSFTILKAAMKELPFDPLARTFVAIVVRDPYVMIVAASSPYQTLQDLVKEAKRDPTTFTWGSLGGAGLQDFGARQFLKAIGVDVTKTKPIMANGGAQVVTLTAGAHLKMGGGTTMSVLAACKAGTVRPLGQVGKARHPFYLNVPTFEELGYPTINEHHWIGVSGPPKLPSSVVKAWNEALQGIFKDPDFIARLKKGGGMPFYLNDKDTREFALQDMEEMKKLWGIQ